MSAVSAPGVAGVAPLANGGPPGTAGVTANGHIPNNLGPQVSVMCISNCKFKVHDI